MSDAVDDPRDEPVDPVDEAPTGRRRMAGVLAVLVAVPVAAWLLIGGGRADGFGQPLPTTPPPDTPATLSVTVEARLEGPIADQLAVELRDHPVGTVTVREGDGTVVVQELVLTNRTDREVALPEGASDPSGALTREWTIDPASGLGVSLGGTTSAARVVAADDDALVGAEVPADRITPWMPRVLHLQVGVPAHDLSDRPLEVSAPFGDGELVVTVTSAPVDDPPPGPWPPVEALVGEELDVPPLGEARSALLGPGHPVWIANTADAGVTVVDARAPGPTGGPTPLVEWCGPREGFVVAGRFRAFDAAGAVVGGSGDHGLTTYGGTVDGGVFTITEGSAGAPQPPRPLERVGGDYRPAGMGGSIAGSWCLGSAPYGGEPTSTPVDLDGLPSAPIDLLPSTGSPSRVTGHLTLEADGRGVLCEDAGPDPWSCAGEAIAVDLSGTVPGTWSPDVRRAFDGTFVVGGVAEGVVTALWVERWAEPVFDLTAVLDHRMVARYRTVQQGGPGSSGCGGWPEGCVGTVSFTQLQVLTADGPVEWDGTFPDGWLLVDPQSDMSVWQQQPLTDLADVADGLERGDLVEVRPATSDRGATVEPLTLPD